MSEGKRTARRQPGGGARGEGIVDPSSQHCSTLRTESQAAVSNLDYALSLRRRGWYPIPLCWPQEGMCACPKQHKNPQEVGKAPLLGPGYQSLRPTEDDIRKWWGQWPQANVGVLLGASGVLSIDPDSPQALQEVQALGLPPTIRRVSHHDSFLYRRPEICPITQANHRGSGQLDVKTVGYVVVRGWHQTGCPVMIDADGPQELAAAPQWAVDMLRDVAAKKGKQVVLPEALPTPPDLNSLRVPMQVREMIRTGKGGTFPSRSERHFAVLRELCSAGYDDGVIAAVVLAHPVGAKARERDRAWLGAEIERARASLKERPLVPESPPPSVAGEARAETAPGGEETHGAPAGPGDYWGAVARLGHTIRLNEAGETIEIDGRPLDDVGLATIRHKLRRMGFPCGAAVDDTVKAMADAHRYHPVRAFLEDASRSYDGGQHIAQLARHFYDVSQPGQEDTSYFPHLLRRWLIGAVAKALDGEHNQNPMMVLDGGQGIGKSHFCQWLCEPIPKYFMEGVIDPEDKDAWIRLTSVFVWEVSELGATTRRADVESLKAFISTRVVTVRRPYGRVDMIRPALASFIGTINQGEAGILSDQVQNRRFVIARIKEIDWGYSDAVNPAQIWGEACTAYKAGERWMLDPEERALSEEINERYKTPDVVASYLAQYFQVTGDAGDWLSTAAIVSRLQNVGLREHSSRSLAMEVARVLTSWDVRKEKHTLGTQRVWGYVGLAEKEASNLRPTYVQPPF